MIKNLIFDVDGTLWDSTSIVVKGWKRAAVEYGLPEEKITADVLKKEFGQPMDVIGDHLFGSVADAKLREEILEKCCIYEQQLLEESTEDVSYPGMQKTLEALAGKYRLFIVSNCQCGYIELVVSKNKIAHLIEDYDCFGNTGVSKGETIAMVMERNKIKAGETIYIGDTMGDYKASVAAGIPFIYARYGFGEVPEATVGYDDFAELEPLLEQLDANGCK